MHQVYIRLNSAFWPGEINILSWLHPNISWKNVSMFSLKSPLWLLNITIFAWISVFKRLKSPFSYRFSGVFPWFTSLCHLEVAGAGEAGEVSSADVWDRSQPGGDGDFRNMGGFTLWFRKLGDVPPRNLLQFAMENGHRNSEFSH